MILYKYCDQVGVVKILESLELKLPFISEVNDPLECMPLFYWGEDISALERKCLSSLRNNNMVPSADFRERIQQIFNDGDFRKKLLKDMKKHQKYWNEHKGCLVSVSETSRNMVMWAHYANRHKGVVLGIDFDNIFKEKEGIQMDPVEYHEERQKIDILMDHHSKEWLEEMMKSLLIKSVDWKYEKECRNIFLVDDLEKLQEKGLACLRKFKKVWFVLKGKKAWFLRLHPSSIKEIVFGLYAEESLKTDIRKFKYRQELQHVKLYNAVESDTYDFNLVEEKIA
jgi:hypothetical protein